MSTEKTTAATAPATTPMTIAQAGETRHPLMPKAAIKQHRPLTEAECRERNLPSTSKSKHRMGIDPDYSIVWATPNFSPVDHAILEAFGRSQKTPVADILTGVCMDWFEQNRGEITKAADGFARKEMDAETAVKKMESLERQLAATRELIERMKAEAAPTAEAKAGEAPAK